MRVRHAPFLRASLPLFATAQEAEQSNYHAQNTDVWQHKPAFNARYDGPNCLSAAAEKSWSARVGRFLAFCWPARLATYADALDAVAATNATPTLEAVRDRDRTKGGIGLSVDRKASNDLGLFARVMRSDGRTETDAFTESDRSVSFNLAVTGARWRRAGDTVGAAFAASGLSPEHRTFLARGGQTVFLGDGQLRYAPERVFEADYQRISNPGFNAARGPASFYALRLHGEN